MNKIKIFPIYYKEIPIFRSDVYEPILADANHSDWDIDMLKDNTGDQIVDKNVHLGELTAWYWIWKNYLPQHPELEYIGFCHYRRFFDFEKAPAWGINQYPFSKELHFSEFEYNFFPKMSSGEKIYKRIKNYDVIIPEKQTFLKTVIYDQYPHAREVMDAFIDVVKSNYPEYVEDMNNYLYKENKGCFCLQFVMRADLYENFMEWTFGVIDKVEKKIDFSQYVGYERRTPAFVMERFFNVWLFHQIRTKKVKTLERQLYMLVPEYQRKMRIPLRRLKLAVILILNFFGFNFKVPF